MIKRLAFLLLLWPTLTFAQATNYCNDQNLQTFNGGAVGTNPTAANLASGTKGSSVGSWTNSSGITTYSSVDMPALVAPGRLCGDSITYTNNTGDHSIVFTGDGTPDFDEIRYNLPSNLTKVVASVEYNEDFGPTDPSFIDAFGFQNTLFGFVTMNFYGNGTTRYVELEITGNQSIPTVNWNPITQCPCKVTMTFISSTTSTGFASASVVILDKNGALIASQSGATTVQGIAFPTTVVMGDGCNCRNVTANKHWWYAHLQVSFDGSIPGQFCAGASPTWTSSPDSATLQTCINNISGGDTVNVLSGTATWSTAEVTNFNNKVPMNIIGQTLVSGGGTASPSANDTTPGTSTTIYMSHTAGNGVSLGLAVPRSGCPTPTSTVPCIRLSGLTAIETPVGPAGSIAIYDATNTWPPSAGRFRIDNIHEIVPSSSGTGDMIYTQDVYGVIDHIWSQSHTAATVVHVAHFGDAINKGFLGWNTPLALGTDQAVYIEDSTAQDDFCNTSGFGDGNQGARAVYRYNYELNGHMSAFHGTDSGSELSMFSDEDYHNTMQNNACTTTALTNITLRGGTLLWWSDIFIGTANWAGGKLQQLRADPSTALPGNSDWSTWGGSNGIPWLLNGLAGTPGSQQVTTGGADWQASHSYTCSQAAPCFIIPTSNNTNNYNFVTFSSCMSGSTRPTFNQTAGSTTPDGGNPLPVCNWINQQGTTSTGVNAQFCALNQDVLVTALSQCPSGDQSGPLRFFDGPSSAFGYPGRNQVGRSNNGLGTGETLNPVYQWLNTGVPNPGLFVQNDPTGNFIHECRDYYQQQGSPTFTGACSPGNGVGVGTLAARPTTCTAGLGGNTPGVAYWATDKTTLYVCNPANTWTAYYTPLVHPHPLVGGGGGAPILSICPSINFNFANVGTTNQALCGMINSGGGTLTWTSITVSGAPFSLQPGTCPLMGGSLAPQGTCSFVVIFSPTSQAAFNGTVTINDNSAGAPHTVLLSGNGASVAPAAQFFASNQAGCKQAAPLTPTWCFTADKHIYVSSCTPVACSAFAPFTMTVQTPIPGMTATGTAQ